MAPPSGLCVFQDCHCIQFYLTATGGSTFIKVFEVNFVPCIVIST